MSDAAAATAEHSSVPINELKASANLMTLDNGLFCILNVPPPGAGAAPAATGLPGVRVSLPPGARSRPEAVRICAFRDDGWLGSQGDAALVRVAGGPAQVLVTIYQVPGAPQPAPNIQVMRLLEGAAGLVPAAASADPASSAGPAAGASEPAASPRVVDMLAHIQGRGDVGAVLGDWLGERGSKRWIEGFAIAPQKDVQRNDIEYQAVLGRGWLSPWVEGGQFCGSRGMALPVLGLRVRLRGEAAEKFECRYAASFVDGASVGPVAAGEACESESLAAMEAFQVILTPRNEAAGDAPKRRPRAPARA